MPAISRSLHKQRNFISVNKQIHILLMGSKAFAKDAAALLESCDNVDTRHTAHVTIDLFLAEWRPDCAIVNCDDLEHELQSEIEELSRLQSGVTIILVNSSCISPLAAPGAAAILLPSEVQLRLAPLVTLLTENPHSSACREKCCSIKPQLDPNLLQ